MWMIEAFSLALHVPVHIQPFTFKRENTKLPVSGHFTPVTQWQIIHHNSQIYFFLWIWSSLACVKVIDHDHSVTHQSTTFCLVLLGCSWLKFMSNGWFDLSILPVFMLVIHSSVGLLWDFCLCLSLWFTLGTGLTVPMNRSDPLCIGPGVFWESGRKTKKIPPF